MKKAAILFTLLSLLSLGCTTDDVVIEEVSGRIFDASGMAGLEDCGWMVEINGVNYKPTYLNSQYEQDDFRVFMKVEFLGDRSSCSTLALGPELVRIEQIRPSGN